MVLHELTFLVSGQTKVSPTLSSYLKQQGILSVENLLEAYPTRYQDRSILLPFPETTQEAQGLWLTQKGTVLSHSSFMGKGQKILKIQFLNQAGQRGTLVCFNRPFLAKTLSVGAEFYVYGSFSFNFGEWSSGSFDFEKVTASPPKRFRRLFSLYRGQTQPSPPYYALLEKI